jgi:mannitol/fructose-specific phosphotransferase system IIA component (Ntr-type)
MVFTFKGQDVADTILRFAEEYRVGQIVIGRPRPLKWWQRLRGEHSVAEQLIQRSKGVTVVVVDADSQEHLAGEAKSPGARSPAAGTLSRLLSEQRIIIWNDPASREDIRRRLTDAVVSTTPGLTRDAVLKKLDEREQQGSTFLNEGVALPHARMAELISPQVALGLTHAGVLDAPTEKPVEAIFLLLSPASGANIHLQLLAKVGRALQSRDLRRALNQARTAAEAFEAIQDFEAASSGK